MSEKRFILSVNEDAPNTLDIIDIVADKTYNFVNDVVSMNQAKQLVDLLNELSEENEQLEKGKMEALSLLGEEIDKNEQLKKEHKIAIDEMITDYKNLEKENEQLKRDLEEAIETFEPKLLKLNSDLIHELGVSKSLRDVVKEQDKEIKRLKRNVKRFKDDRDSNFETMKYWKNKALKESEDE